MHVYKVTKTYGHNLGLSAAFRQHRADSHCAQLHGYALEVTVEFEADTLNSSNWVIGFGDLSVVKDFLTTTFDHKTLIAEDDPQLYLFQKLAEEGVINLVVLKSVGCEAFAEHIAKFIEYYLKVVCDKMPDSRFDNKPRLNSVEVREHSGNAASWVRK